MPKVLFHHLAKTAGTSLIANLERIFAGRVCEARYDHELTLEVICDETLALYHGHYSFAAVRRFKELNPDAFIFTFVRHPFNRVLSQYYNWVDRDRVLWELDSVAARSGPEEKFDARREKFEQSIFRMSLDAFLTDGDPDIREVTFNHQAGYTSDEACPEFSKRLASAVGNILSFYQFVGVVELYDPCLRILELKLGLEPGAIEAAHRANTNDHVKTGGKYQITARQFATLVQNNGYDMALHAAAFTRLMKDYSTLIERDAWEYADVIAGPEVRD